MLDSMPVIMVLNPKQSKELYSINRGKQIQLIENNMPLFSHLLCHIILSLDTLLWLMKMWEQGICHVVFIQLNSSFSIYLFSILHWGLLFDNFFKFWGCIALAVLIWEAKTCITMAHRIVYKYYMIRMEIGQTIFSWGIISLIHKF